MKTDEDRQMLIDCGWTRPTLICSNLWIPPPRSGLKNPMKLDSAIQAQRHLDNLDRVWIVRKPLKNNAVPIGQPGVVIVWTPVWVHWKYRIPRPGFLNSNHDSVMIVGTQNFLDCFEPEDPVR